MILLILPFIAHTFTFITRLRSNEAQWAEYGSNSYEIILASNSLDDPTGGINQVTIENGQIISGHNPDCALCGPGDFRQFTVEALFARIWKECVQDRLLRFSIPICNVAYDPELGFPRRLDTYTFTQEGKYQSSITVERVSLDP
jgi:hypothetical protein